MKLVRWSFQGLHVPMVETDDGILYCTLKQIAGVLQTTEKHIRQIRKRHPDEFDTLRDTKCIPKKFLEQHRIELGILRLKEDLILLSEDAMILSAVLIKTNVGKEFRRNLVAFIKQHARKDYMPVAEHIRAVNEVHKRIDAMQECLNDWASSCGRNLNAQKQIKHLRIVN